MLSWLVENTILACLLAIVVTGICRLFRPRPAIRHAMWLLVLVKLIAPAVPYLSWRLPDYVWLAQSRSDDIVQPGAIAPGGETSHSGERPPRATSRILDVGVVASGPVVNQSPNVSTTHLYGDSTSPAQDAVVSPRLAASANGASDSVETAVGDEWTEEAALEASLADSITGEDPAVVIESIEYLPIADGIEHQGPPQRRSSDDEAGIRIDPTAVLSAVLVSEQTNRVAAYLWLFLTAGMAVFECGRVLRFRRLVASAQPASPWLVSQVEESARQLKIRPPEVLVTAGCCSPVLWALGRPRLLWPQRLTALLSSTAMQGVIVHELAHLARRDHWVRRLELVAGCAWWWHPLLWFVRRQLHENAEMACDAWVVSANPEGRRAYAQALIEVIDFSQQRPLPAPALGAADATRRTFERRLRMIMRERIQSRVSLAAGVLLLLACVAVLPGFSRGQDAGAPDEPEVPGDAIPEDAASFPAEADPVGDFLPSPDAPTADITTAFDLPPADAAAEPSPLDLPDLAANEPIPDSTPNDGNPAIRRLEEQLEVLMREVKALRSQHRSPNNPYASSQTNYARAPSRPTAARSAYQASAPATEARPVAGTSLSNTEKRVATQRGRRNPYSSRLLIGPSSTQAYVETSTGGSVLLGGPAPANEEYAAYGATNVRMLTRVTYGLPEGKAQALARFLDEQAGDRIESKAVGQSLVVTASEADQQIVGRFVALIASAKASPGSQDIGDSLMFDDGATAPADGTESGNDDLFSAPDDGTAVQAIPDTFGAGQPVLDVPADEATGTLDPLDASHDGASNLDPFSEDNGIAD